MARLYYRLFYQLHCFSSDVNQEGREEWKALTFVNILCILLVVEMGVWLDIAVKWFTGGTLVSWPSWLAWVVAGACSLGNYVFFLDEDRWNAYAPQFRAESVHQRRWAAWGAFAAVLAVLGSVVGAFYCMSRMEWGN